MKKVLILFGRSNWQKARPFHNKEYQYSYEYFYELCKQNDIQMYRASYEWYDYEKKYFKHAWIFEGSGGNWKKVHNIKPDLIYDKTKARMEIYYKKELIQEHFPFINDLNFTRILDDKLITSLIFNKWSKKSWLIDSLEDLRGIATYIDGDRIVLKPISESGGKGVHILSKKDLSPARNILSRAYIAQEFIDSSGGIAGICKGMHDLRLVLINEKVIYAYIREPKKGSFLANLAQGGSLHIVPQKALPKSLQPVLEYAHKVFITFTPRIYSIDFMFDEQQRPWIVELNSMPGLNFTEKEKPSMITFYGEILKVFQKKLGL